MVFGNNKHRGHEQQRDDSCIHAPLKYFPELKLEKNSIVFKTIFYGEDIKESITIYENGIREELLLTIRDLVAMAKSYKL